MDHATFVSIGVLNIDTPYKLDVEKRLLFFEGNLYNVNKVDLMKDSYSDEENAPENNSHVIYVTLIPGATSGYGFDLL